EFRANFSLGGSVRSFELGEEDRKLALTALEKVDLAVGGVDLLITENRRYVLEVNHTPGMLGMEAATGENITRAYLEYAVEHAK
ncbi:MAG: 30S ribosomal protein S6--L-glutamate ligase, partial [Candidatus Blackburnbacteria bacterium]|nr:30S ribosomal protein S6--L-glutamate ligase [Candidatus Blackburnbacteria bacterium]